MTNKHLYITLLALLGFTTDAAAQDTTRTVPRLVINITIDQLRSDYLEAFSPLYGKGGFKRLLTEGLVYDNASYPFSTIDRASAISSVFTGVSPYYHSIVGEKWLDKETLRSVLCTDDKRKPGLDSPAQMQVSSICDELKVATEGQAKIFAIAPQKDAAILSAGHAADAAYWIEDFSGQWKTSEYYLNTLPSWVLYINQLQSPNAKIQTQQWEPVFPLAGTFNYYQHIGNQKPFKHVFKDERKFIEYKASGLVNTDVTDLATQCVTNHGLGYDV